MHEWQDKLEKKREQEKEARRHRVERRVKDAGYAPAPRKSKSDDDVPCTRATNFGSGIVKGTVEAWREQQGECAKAEPKKLSPVKEYEVKGDRLSTHDLGMRDPVVLIPKEQRLDTFLASSLVAKSPLMLIVICLIMEKSLQLCVSE